MLRLQRIAWRTDSCAECKGPGGEDLSGGYYEAGGSYLKFSFPTAFTLTQLAWGVVQYRDGYAKVQHRGHAPPQGIMYNTLMRKLFYGTVAFWRFALGGHQAEHTTFSHRGI